MEMIEEIKKQLLESARVKTELASGPEMKKVVDLVEVMKKALRNGNKIIFAGNGGSFADSIHLAAEFVCRFKMDRAPLAAIALGANNSALTAIGNDYSFEDIFVRELEALGQKGDVFVGFTTSGNSANIIKCVDQCKKKGIHPYIFTGANGGKIAGLCPCIHVPSSDVPRIQESHISMGHVICEVLEKELFNNNHK
jgi:D-sedoheptulose 7-phosphate isomerase